LDKGLVPVKQEPVECLDQEVLRPVLYRDGIKARLKEINPAQKIGRRLKRPDENCLDCVVACHNWLNTGVLVPAPPKGLENANYSVVGKAARLLDQDNAKALHGHDMQFIIHEHDEPTIDQAQPYVVQFVSYTFDEMVQQIKQLPLGGSHGGQHFASGLFLLEHSDSYAGKLPRQEGIDGHFLNFYIYRDNGVREYYIIDPQDDEIRTLATFIKKDRKLYKEPIYMWVDINGKSWPTIRYDVIL
jgi:hypothetical protein